MPGKDFGSHTSEASRPETPCHAGSDTIPLRLTVSCRGRSFAWLVGIGDIWTMRSAVLLEVVAEPNM